MTVRDLICRLETYDPNLVVVYTDNEDGQTVVGGVGLVEVHPPATKTESYVERAARARQAVGLASGDYASNVLFPGERVV